MSKKLGIDLGSSSLGWFLRDGDIILRNGVVIFNSGMVKDKSGGYTSPTKDRREARSKRRLIQARKYRKWGLLEILIEYSLVPLNKNEFENWSKYQKGKIRKFPESKQFQKWLACDFSYLESGVKYKNPYELRVRALDSKLEKHELGRVLYHIVQRRGYKDIGEQDKETKTQIERRGSSGFDAAMNENRTIGEALKRDFLDKGKRARNEYPYRVEYENELVEILKAQGYIICQDDKKVYTDEFVQRLIKAIIWQRPLRSQKGNIGKCTLEPTKPRCPASHPIFEIFRAWSYINTIKTVEWLDERRKKIDDIPLEFKQMLFDNVFLKQDKNFKFEKIQKQLDKLFQKKMEYNYLNRSTKKYDSSVSGMPICKGLISHFGGKVKDEIMQLHTYNIGSKDHKIIKNYSVYDLWHIIFETDKDYLEDFAVNKLGITTVIKTNNKGEKYSENPIVKFKSNAFSINYSNLSLKAMCKIIPFLQGGFLYDEAVLLAKIPECVDNWEGIKELVYKILRESNSEYNFNKEIITISNGLIDSYKVLLEDYRSGRKEYIFAYKDYEYLLQDDDLNQVKAACESFYGKKTWQQKDNKEDVLDRVKKQYQQFFFDFQREYRKILPLKDLITAKFKKNGIKLKGSLYHHSDRKNLYPKPVNSTKHGKKVLAVPLIDSIKNPMFNKSMSILRKLINDLIIKEYVNKDGVVESYLDEDTEVIIEVARELNDNNKRIAIERFQKERRNEREKIRQFIDEFKDKNIKYSGINTEEKIRDFELWEEQTFEVTVDETGKKVSNRNPIEIRKEKDAVKRYELWSEQKGQCMYTGKMISISKLFSSEIQIEHTIPRSILPDNTMANLTVCFSKYNSDIKNNKMPKECPNYDIEKTLPGVGSCSAIAPRLEKWEKLRDHYKELYQSNSKSFGNEDEKKKNGRIQKKHYYKMHFDYWKDKVDRFTTEEIKESWVRRQLVDTQMVSKYAREFLKTYFKKVLVQKGSTTADFRKIFGVQEDEKKDRSKHTHHSIDAAVLTLIPTSSSKRVLMLKQLYREEENKQKVTRKDPDGFHNFNSQLLVDLIENETLIVNYEKDKITAQTYRNVRKRGKCQYLKNGNGEFVKNIIGDKVLLKSKGASIRGNMFQDTYIGRIKNVERDDKGKPIRGKDGEWKYLEGEDEYTYTVRKPIADAKIEDIIDPQVKSLIAEQLNNGIDIRGIKDFQGNIIRRVRVKVKAGKKVKNRVNYKSKHDYKNSFYSAAGEIPYAIFITNLVNGRPKRKMIPVPIHEVAQIFREYHKFTPESYLHKFHPNITNYDDLKLLKVGQKVFVLNQLSEYEKRKYIDFQKNRMYKITQFFVDGSGGVYLKYHLEATKNDDIDMKVKECKHLFLKQYDVKFELDEIKEDVSIEDINDRKKDFNNRKYKFVGIKDYRFKRLIPYLGEEKVKEIKKQVDKYKKQSSTIEKEGETPLLKITSTDCEFLFEGYDFDIDIIGQVKWLD